MRRLTLTALLGLSLLVAPSALAARPKLTVAPRYGKALVPRAWQPVTVTVTNPKDGAAFSGEVILSQGSNQWRAPITLPAGDATATVSLTIYERPESWLPHTITLRSNTGEVVQSSSWSPAVKPERLLRVLVISKDGSAGSWAALDGQVSGMHHSGGRLVPGSPRHLPGQPAAKSNLPEEDYFSIVTATPNQLSELASDLDQFGIIVDAVGLGLSGAQYQPVHRWVNAGGVLILTPADADDSSDIPMRQGAGSTIVNSALPSVQALIAPRNHVASMRSSAITLGEDESLRYTGGQGFLPEVLHNSGMEAPPFSTIALFLGAYLIAVVPLQYIILRRLDKREWAWGTTPLLACGFAAGAYFVGSQGRPSAISYSCAAVIETRAGQTTGAAVARFGLYSPSRATFGLTAPTADTVFFSTVGDQTSLSQLQSPGQPTQLTDFSVPQWAMRSVSLHTTNLPLGGGVGVALERRGSRLTGTVTNNTGATLTDVQVHFAGGQTSFPVLAPGKSQTVDFACSDVSTRISFSNTAYSAFQSHPLLASTLQSWSERYQYEVSESLARRDEALVTALTTQELVSVKVEGGAAAPKATNSLLIVHAPFGAE